MGNTEAKPAEQHYDEHLVARYEELSSDGAVALSDVTRLLQVPGLSTDRLSQWIKQHGLCNAEDKITLDSYSAIVATFLGKHPAEVCFNLYKDGENTISEAACEEMFNMCRIVVLSRFCDAPRIADTSAVTSIVKGLFWIYKDGEPATHEHFIRWTRLNVPNLFHGLVLWIKLQLTLPLEQHSKQRKLDVFASILLNLPLESDDTIPLMTANSAWMLLISLPELFTNSGNWSELYSTAKNGQSLTQFQRQTHNYKGPTLTLVRDDKDALYVAGVDQEWLDQPKQWGGEDCCLLRLYPTFHKISKPGIQVYSDVRTRHATHGIGFGLEPTKPETASLWLNKDLAKGFCSYTDQHFVGVSAEFTVFRVEVYGCSEVSARQDQIKAHHRDDAAAEMRQSAERPKPEEWHDSVDRQLLTMAGALTIDEQSRVSTDRSAKASDMD
eukprot:m.354201 g.354201  ORF g.354201 m.354201 type:complete len:440 (-) comp16950_c0_seq1:278-1597(-)